jgi:hypothetical protein
VFAVEWPLLKEFLFVPAVTRLRHVNVVVYTFGPSANFMKTPHNKLLFAVALSFIALVVLGFRSKEAVLGTRAFPTASSSAAKLSTLPGTILWAWERPEKLDFIDPTRVGVAFLAKTIYLRRTNVVARPRLQSLKIPDGTKLIAVARIETNRRDVPNLTTSQIEGTAAEVASLGQLPNVSAVQIDFDATLSERDFYRSLLVSVRGKLPIEMPLSITALASWCDGDSWLSDLPIDEAVPMLFRLGVENRRFTSRLRSGEKLRAPACQYAAGVSTDEPMELASVHRLYIFNPTSWSPVSFKGAMEVYHR